MTARRNWLFTSAIASVALVILSCAEPTAPVVQASRTDVTPVTSVVPGATLVECPTDQTVTSRQVIGPLGGSVTAAGTTILIPPGAVLEPRTFDVTVPASRYMEVSITAVGSGHYKFLLPVSVTLDYSRCEGNSAIDAPLSVYYVNDITKTLLQLMVGSDDKAARKFNFTTDHLSGYAIAN